MINVRQLRKLNPWIKTDAQARNIIRKYNSNKTNTAGDLVTGALNKVLTEAQTVKQNGQY